MKKNNLVKQTFQINLYLYLIYSNNWDSDYRIKKDENKEKKRKNHTLRHHYQY